MPSSTFPAAVDRWATPGQSSYLHVSCECKLPVMHPNCTASIGAIGSILSCNPTAVQVSVLKLQALLRHSQCQGHLHEKVICSVIPLPSGTCFAATQKAKAACHL